MKKILILGINGFIGNQLTKKILNSTDWEIYGMDLATNKLDHSIKNGRLHFTEGDITINKEWITYHIKKCDVILPLVAIATPATYVTDPLRIFELDFEANLPLVRQCVQFKKRLIFPSTSEVYGMSPDKEFDEETSPFMQGPINKERWIYSCSKQLMDRIIYAYGKHNGLKYILFRPFNWIGPTQDDIHNLPPGGVRVITQFISNIYYGKDLQLVDGGKQKRCFIYIDDAIDALLRIIENKDDRTDNKIINIGNPKNNASIAEIAQKIVEFAKKCPKGKAKKIKIISTTAKTYYGSGYQDMNVRIPSIKRAHHLLGWQPKTSLDMALKKTVDYYLR
ncbi:MAG: bifunctional UDP-4-keto-pentose/UDP-xylose synthase [Coxiellaceae bacterium]|jgi:nucleoside-diphosphate-sugar epimerase|nr:bifunctional UDP-4-keto-pentose/UDP-xylose synthase [Coxiellaceae bacterium]